MVNVLGISASPRRGGNSDVLLDEALAGASSAGATVAKIVLNDLTFRPCQECGGCDTTGICVVRDDMGGVYEKFAEADVVIVASPIFFGSLSAQLKMMIDRFQCAWAAKYLLKKRARKRRRGAYLCVSAAKKSEFFENAREIVRIFFKTLDIEYTSELFCAGVDKKRAIDTRSDILEKAFAMGADLVKGQ